MNIHEYQAKEVLRRYGIPVPDFEVVSTMEEARSAIDHLRLKKGVVKIQVHAGGRGKAGGVQFGKTPEEILKKAKELLGMKMVNRQTGPQGVIAHQVLIAEPLDIVKEFYLGAVIDRKRSQPVILASPEGGMDIEEVAEKHPDKILTLPILLNGTMRSFHLLRLANFMGWDGNIAKEGMKITEALAKAFIDNDASLLEINPFVLTKEGRLIALDAKLSVDDNALYRQPDIAAYYDPTQISINEAAAKEYDLAYIALEGNIGCMVNGAGLAMATMDIIHYYGGKPANFLDVGGGASKEKISEGFKIILADVHVKAILVNIFGGIMNCATLAEGIIHACAELNMKVPLIVRMEGTNVEEGKKMLERSNLKITIARDLADAAKLAVESTKR